MIRRTAVLVLLLLTFLPTTGIARDTWNNVERIIAIGDLHGDYEQYVRVMTMSGLMDARGNWRGGKTHLVQLGDIPDRGPDSLKIIESIRSLQKQARRAGGFVHPLIGNHEAMNIYGDLRYVHPGEYAALVTGRSGRYRNDYFRDFVRHIQSSQPDFTVEAGYRESWNERFPLGYVEHRTIWQAGGDIAKWVAGNNTIIQINDILFVHGGLNPHATSFMKIRDINRQVKRELAMYPLPMGTLVESEQGPLWYRGLAQNPVEKERAPLEKMLAHYGARHIIVGHTPTRGFIHPRFDRQAIMADVGIAGHYGARAAVLLIENGKMTAIHRGTRIPLPDDGGFRTYLEDVAKLEPDPAPIRRIIDQIDQRAAQDQSAAPSQP